MRLFSGALFFTTRFSSFPLFLVVLFCLKLIHFTVEEPLVYAFVMAIDYFTSIQYLCRLEFDLMIDFLLALSAGLQERHIGNVYSNLLFFFERCETLYLIA